MERAAWGQDMPVGDGAKVEQGAEVELSDSLYCGLGMVKWYRTGRGRGSHVES